MLMKSALFVDFDNVYSSLRRLDVAVAERFASQPLRWIQWLTDCLPAPPHAPTESGRRLLVRRCYWNPQVYQRFRPAFNRAGFEIIDCPAMTSDGKTSTDIHMVLDIVDLLQHAVHYDEFILFSADADFTPVLRKLRRWDRRTTVLAVGFPSAAYKASADLFLDQDEFVRAALGFDEPDADDCATDPAPGRSAADIARHVTTFIVQTVGSADKPVQLPWLASKAPASIQGLDPADWCGRNSFRALVDSLRLAPLIVDWEAGVVLDPAKHSLPERAPANASPTGRDGQMEAIAALVRQEVARARRPLPCGRLAQLITDQYGAIAADWGGKGSFRKFLDALNLDPLRADWSAAGGRVLDPQRADDPGEHEAGDAQGWGPDQALAALIGQIHAATGMPLLSPDGFALVIRCLHEDLAEHPFVLSETGKRVRDRCREAGTSIARGSVSFILKGILLGGHEFGDGLSLPSTTATAFVRSVLDLCRREQLHLDDTQVQRLHQWAGLHLAILDMESAGASATRTAPSRRQ
jgi:hypothetical protein